MVLAPSRELLCISQTVDLDMPFITFLAVNGNQSWGSKICVGRKTYQMVEDVVWLNNNYKINFIKVTLAILQHYNVTLSTAASNSGTNLPATLYF